MAVGVERRAKKVASRLDHALLLQPVSNAMSFDPLTQLPGPGFPVPESTTAIQGREDHPPDYNPNLSGQAAESASQQANKKRRPSKDKASTSIRRSSSTPHMRNLALGASGELSPTADKRRNKLGYHRTSVACGHCRRRKIRCLVAQDEPTGRCANCIRLKKECNFYPVDQAPEPQRSQTGAIKDSSSVAPGSSTTSSPRHPPSMPGEKGEDFRAPFSGAAPVMPPARYGVPADSEMEHHRGPPSSGMSMHQPPYGYPHAIDTQWPPATGFLPSSSVAESPSSTSGFWRPSPSTANSTYGSESNISGGRTPATMSTTSNMSYGGHTESHNWGPQGFQPPTRSMSYGNIEGLPQQYANQGLGIHQQDFPRRTSPYPYPTTIDTAPATIQGSSLGPHTSAPLSAPILPNHQFNYPPPWNPNAFASGQAPGHEIPVQSRSMSGQWYAEPGQLGQVQEEGAPQMPYSHHGMQQFYSGP